MWKRILVPHDFSELGVRAVGLASRLAKHCGAEVVLFHATDMSGELPPEAKITPAGKTEPVRVDEYVGRGALERLGAVAKTIDPSIQVKCAVGFGPVAEQILLAVAEHDADVIVMATHGRGGLAHALLGSVAEEVVRKSLVPVISCRGTGGAPHLTQEELDAQDELYG
jgi:nucleotide-binding universal stress UspA family protein